MKLVTLPIEKYLISSDLARSVRSKQFEERLKHSIMIGGLAEPLKAARTPDGQYLVVDGVQRLRAIHEIRNQDPQVFKRVPAYVIEYSKRHEVRYQSDIYQDLLPSQLAQLVEHLHEHENISKIAIAEFIGVSPATLRNYTGLWRLVQRRGLFAQIVELMDLRVVPASNPYAWLRLTDEGIREVIEKHLSDGAEAEDWIEQSKAEASSSTPYSIKFIEFATGHLSASFYREDVAVRAKKRDLGLRRARSPHGMDSADIEPAITRLRRIARNSEDPVLRTAATSLERYLA